MARALIGTAMVALIAAGVVLVVRGDGSPGRASLSPVRPARTPRAVSEDDVRAHLAALAAVARRSDGNRAAGTAGDRASAAYAAKVLRGAGWRVEQQPVPFPYFDERRPPRVWLGGRRRLRAGRDMLTMSYSSGGDARGRVRVVGLTPGRASDAGCRRSDFRRLRAGEVAVVQRGTCTLRAKALNAQRRGAAAVLIANDGLPGRTAAVRGTLGAPGIRVPVLALSTVAGGLVARAGRVRVSVDAVSGRRTTRNVVAEAGAGARVVMAGAHLDSVPDGPGINDDGSGTAAVLAIARALQAQAPSGATVRLALWGAEELGLYGSRRYVGQLGAAERRRIAAYVNLDMVGGRGQAPGVYRGDARTTRVLRRELRRRGRRAGFRSAGRGSDHVPFDDAGIPVGGVFTGLDRCYHRGCDDLDNVDAAVVTDVAAATAATLRRLARR